MQKYVYLFHVGTPIDLSGDFEEKNTQWFASLSKNLIDGGNPFNPKSEAKVSAGKVEKDPDSVAGYCIVNAENLDEAVAMAKECPLAIMPGCAVKVYEKMAM